MASYGTFINACGLNYHGPKGQIRFAPKIGTADFRAPFTAATGWGTYSQERGVKGQFLCELKLNYGQLDLNEFHLADAADLAVNKKQIIVQQNNKLRILGDVTRRNTRLVLTFKDKLILRKGNILKIQWA